MPYFVTLKHGDIERFETAVEAVRDYMECIDNPPGHGAEMWWESEEEAAEWWENDCGHNDTFINRAGEYVCIDCGAWFENGRWQEES